MNIKNKLRSLGMIPSRHVSQLLQTLTTRARPHEPEENVPMTTKFPVFDFQNNPNMCCDGWPLNVRRSNIIVLPESRTSNELSLGPLSTFPENFIDIDVHNFSSYFANTQSDRQTNKHRISLYLPWSR